METQFKVYSASAGSGKTFTLVKEYLKIVLGSKDRFAFQKILAITFTNKAAAEMKERVLGALKEFSKVDLKSKWPDLFVLLHHESNIPPQVLKDQAGKVLHEIMQNYASLSITTIDSFTHRLIRTFAFDLGIPMNFEIEMDAQKLISEAVDLLLDQLGEHKEITEALKNFIEDKISLDQDWNISRDLNEIAGILNREVDALEFKAYEETPMKDFTALEKALRARENEIASKFSVPALKAISAIKGEGLKKEDFSYSGRMYTQFLNFCTPLKSDLTKFSEIKKITEDKKPYTAKTPEDIKSSVDAIYPILQDCAFEILKGLENEEENRITFYKSLRKELIPLAVLNRINLLLEELKSESNIKFIAEFNRLISEAIIDEPAPFIYERLGEKYQYFFIDEMQDTSELQWENLIPLMHNALASEGSQVMLVGDGKQSIYRFRGGKAEQFIGLSSEEVSGLFHTEKKVINLDTNYRSYSKVVEFNNSFFTYMSKYLENPLYKQMYQEQNNQLLNSKKGGYVQLNLVDQEDSQENSDEVLAQLEQQILQRDPKYKLGEICVLVRTSKDGVNVADYLSEKGYAIVSSETLRVANSSKVEFLIDTLRSIADKKDERMRMRMALFLRDHLHIEGEQDTYFAALHKKTYPEFQEALKKEMGIEFSLKQFENLPFYDAVEYLIRCFKLLDSSDAYVQFFLDFVLEYQQKNYVQLSDFLEYWDLKAEKLSIVAPENDQAIRIMTIHKSKGLEFPMVICAFSHRITPLPAQKIWASMPEEVHFDRFKRLRIGPSKKSEGISSQIDQELEVFRNGFDLDTINLIYVAFTRASEQLYIIMQKGRSGNSMSYLQDFVENSDFEWQGGSDQGQFCFGSKERPLEAKSKEQSGFEFQEGFTSSPWEDHQIKVVQEGSKYWDSSQGEAIAFGNKLHEIMSEVLSFKDVDFSLDHALNKGLIGAEEYQPLKNQILQIVSSPALEPYYKEGLKVYNERSMVGNHGELLIPDRLVFEGEKVVIIDYKTGKKDIKYLDQLDGYGYVLAQMGYKVTKKILIYTGENLDIEVYD
ncbi:MAG: UvrD-helicase domain-containing protein [Flavobacteriaceae bacterium]